MLAGQQMAKSHRKMHMAAAKKKASKSKGKSKRKANNAYVKPVKLNSLSPTKRRIAIAEDVIAGLRARRLEATPGTYVSGNVMIQPDGKDQNFGDGIKSCELQEVLATQMKSCEVCAKGAMFIAAVEKFDKVKLVDIHVGDNPLGRFSDDDSICDHLENYFSRAQLDLIEAAFEGDTMDIEVETEECQIAMAYQYRYPDHADRMTAIMKNIVMNNGKFVCKL